MKRFFCLLLAIVILCAGCSGTVPSSERASSEKVEVSPEIRVENSTLIKSSPSSSSSQATNGTYSDNSGSGSATQLSQAELTTILTGLIEKARHLTRFMAIDYTGIPIENVPTTEIDGVKYAEVDFSTWENVKVNWKSCDDMKSDIESTFVSVEESGPISSLLFLFSDVDGKLYFNTTLCSSGSISPKWLPETALIKEQSDTKIVIEMKCTFVDKTCTRTLELVKGKTGEWVFNSTYWAKLCENG